MIGSGIIIPCTVRILLLRTICNHIIIIYIHNNIVRIILLYTLIAGIRLFCTCDIIATRNFDPSGGRRRRRRRRRTRRM